MEYHGQELVTPWGNLVWNCKLYDWCSFWHISLWYWAFFFFFYLPVEACCFFSMFFHNLGTARPFLWLFIYKKSWEGEYLYPRVVGVSTSSHHLPAMIWLCFCCPAALSPIPGCCCKRSRAQQRSQTCDASYFVLCIYCVALFWHGLNIQSIRLY